MLQIHLDVKVCLKEVQKYVERLVTYAKKNNVHGRRLILKKVKGSYKKEKITEDAKSSYFFISVTKNTKIMVPKMFGL